MIPLPIDDALPEIIALARDSRRLVLVAEPGAGKTTRVPPALLSSGLLAPGHPTLVLLQPRRVAARASAARIADEQGWDLGGRVGYQVRFERRIGPETRLEVVTEGILNRRLVANPFLDGIGAVVLDEFHERSLHTDLALALLREVRDAVRPDLLVVVMSATLDAEPVARFLGDAPIVRVPGRTFPVAVEYRPPTPPPTGQRREGPQAIARAVADAVIAAALDGPKGDILAFLPGVEEIRRAERQLAPWAEAAGAVALPLHGSLPGPEQDRALRPDPRRKVVLATNIAETSLTIDGVTTVVDSGLARVASFDAVRGLDRLELARISRASTDQRAGRAGRTAPGRCIRLWSEREQRGLPAHDRAEVQRVDLAGTVLALRAWGVADPLAFGWFEAPDPAALVAAERLLVFLGALDGPGGAITSIGRQLLRIPAHPRLGRLLVAGAEVGATREAATIAGLLAEKDILSRGDGPGRRPEVHGESDLLIRLDRLQHAEARRFAPSLRDEGIDPAAARQAAQIRDDLLRAARRLPGGAGSPPTGAGLVDEAMIRRLALAAYPDRVVRRRGESGATGLMVGGRGVRLDPASSVREAEFFVALDPRESRRDNVREAAVRVASAIDPAWLDDLFPGAVRVERGVVYNPERRRAVGVVARRYLDLTLSEDRNAPAPPDLAAAALAEAFAPEGRTFFERHDGSRIWLLRYDLARAHLPEANDWPDLRAESDAWPELVALACQGKRLLEDAERAASPALLQTRLTYAQNRRLDDAVPEALTVPSGSRIKLEYRPDGPPILAARLQELFGWTETPRVAGGRVAVLIHLLGPNYRPVQVTDDLASFWATTYFQVRKDLRNRYPKHAWPEDPLAARAEARGGRRREPPA